MKQRQLIENICIILLRNKYTVKSLVRSGFDIVARLGGKIILVKAVEDANTLSRQAVEEMTKVAEYMQAVPLIVADKAGFLLERNIVYSRHGVYTLNLDTFENSVRNRMPFIKSSRAGPTVQLSGEMLRKRREDLGLSLNELAARIGVSRKMIQKYESGGAEVTIQKAVRMHDTLGNDVFKRIDIFSRPKLHVIGIEQKGVVSKKYLDLGFKAAETRKSPFDVIAKRNKEVILTTIGDKVNPNVEKVGDLIDADRLMIYKKKKPKDIPSLKRKEFLEIEKAKALIKFLKEF
ncbi:helix-turn-helix domain-containing protein [Candidatus Woesearchaeota archaeon]|nr:helix-turn-helix domain-containing protein [Candidatus Woesearchaeota archaeon]